MKSKNSSTPSLWTRDFTIITIGSAVSMFGNAMSGFVLSLLVLDYTASALYYAIFMAVFNLPQIIMPIFSGALLDRFSRKKTIYILDFISSGLYLSAGFILGGGWFSFPVLACYSFVVGSINSIYTVAYQSFYPMLISEGNFSKAYSVSSFIETTAAVMIPVSTFIYKNFGISPILFANSACFLIAAITETRIKAKENYKDGNNSLPKLPPSGKRLLSDIREGLIYLISEKGLLAISVYFAFNALSSGAATAITLPYFKSHFSNGEYLYMVVWGMALVGKAVCGALHYRIKLPVHSKYRIALLVVISAALLEGFYLYFPVAVMIIMCFANGLLNVTSYTIRISTTQHYVPNEKRGRFNGAFNMLSTAGNLTGTLIAGALTTVVSSRGVLTGFMLANTAAALIFIGGNRGAVKKVFNTDQ